jgi:ATP-binding cassette subfamily F protein 3
MIQLSSVTKSFGARVLIEDVTWQVADRDIVGLCGPNGAGKTTLLRIFANLDEPDAGLVAKPADLRVGYLPQDGLTHEGHTLHEEAALAFDWLLDVRKEMEAIEEPLQRPAGSVSAARRVRHRPEDRHRAARPRVQP